MIACEMWCRGFQLVKMHLIYQLNILCWLLSILNSLEMQTAL